MGLTRKIDMAVQNRAHIWTVLSLLPPILLVLSDVSDVSVKLDWVAGGGQDGHSIERSEDGITYAEIDTVLGATVTYIDTALTPYALYYYRVRAFKGTKFSAYSNIDSETTLEPAILSDGNTVAWYDYQKSETITKDVNNLISRWNDRLGSGHDLLQATESAQPTLQETGVLFGGAASMESNFTFIQPEFCYVLVKQKAWAPGKTIIDGAAANNRMGIIQTNATPQIALYAQTAFINSAGVAIDSFGIIRALFDGANSKIIINESAPVTGNPGTVQAGGVSIGTGGGTASTAFSNIEIKEAIFRKISDTAENEAIIYNYLKKKIAETNYLLTNEGNFMITEEGNLIISED